MRTGKISENVLKRSVLRQINGKQDKRMKGAGIGEDCAFLSYPEKNPAKGVTLAVSTQTVALPVRNAGYLAVMAAANNLAAGGAKAEEVFLSVLLPKDAQEETLREIMSRADGCCQEIGSSIAGGHTEVSPSVQNPVITATAIGRKEELPQTGQRLPTKQPFQEEQQGKKCVPQKKQPPDQMGIVASKWIAMEGTAIVVTEKEEELAERYSSRFLREAGELAKGLSVAEEAAIALKSDVYTMHDVRNGGIFAALWEISRRIGVGLTIDLKKIPVRQETIELCEFYELNPYELLSGGMLLMITPKPEALVEALEGAGIPAVVIGTTNNSNDKLVLNQGEARYLEPPAADEILKIFYV